MHWQKRFDVLRSRLIDYDASHVYLDGDASDREDEEVDDQPTQTLIDILQDTCSLLREARQQSLPEYQTLFEEVTALMNRAVAGEVSGGFGPACLASFAHAPGTLLKDPLQKMLSVESKRDLFTTFASFIGLDVSKVDDFITEYGPPIAPWDEMQQPHPKSSVLSRFREGIDFPSPATHPRAAYVWQARCEIVDDDVSSGRALVVSEDGTFAAMSAAEGWKHRDPVVKYWDCSGEILSCNSLSPPLAHHIQHMIFDDSRRLLFIADYDRVNSYRFLPGTSKRATHTLKADSHRGPLAILANGRLVKAGEGSALVWNIDELATHFPTEDVKHTKIGEGTYRGFEDSWRDKDCKKEKSVGSEAHTTLPFADRAYAPDMWHWHAAQGRMLCAEDPKTERFDCVLLDLEHGGSAAARFIGHGDAVQQFSTSAEAPDVFLTACADGYARLFDVRGPLPVLTMDSERQNGAMEAAVLVHLDGLPGVFTGGMSNQNVRFWDVRARKAVYELSTGNNGVKGLAWCPLTTTLFASTVRPNPCEYRKARRVPKCRRRRDADKDAEASDVHAEDSEEEDEEDEWYEFGRRWPKKAFHQEEFFGAVYDCRTDALLRYSFKEDPDADIFPE